MSDNLQDRLIGAWSPENSLDEIIALARSRLPWFSRIPGVGLKMLAVVALLALVGWMATGFYKVQPDEVGLVLQFGRWERTSDPGLNYHLPYPIETVLLPKVTQVNQLKIGGSGGDQMLTGDENIVEADAAVFWKVKNPLDYMFKVYDPEGMVKVAAESAIHEVIGRRVDRSGLEPVRDLARQRRRLGPDQAADPRGRPRARRLPRRHLARHPDHGRRPAAPRPADPGPPGRHRRPAPDRGLGEGRSLLDLQDRARRPAASPMPRSPRWTRSGTPSSSSWTSTASTGGGYPPISNPARPSTVCWSPDGSRLALNLLDARTRRARSSSWTSTARTIHFRKLPLPPGRWNLQVCDWKTLAPDIRLGAIDPPPDSKTLRGRYQALLQEFEKAGRSTGRRQNAKTPDERIRAYQEKFPRPGVRRAVPPARRVGAVGPVGRRCAGLDRAVQRRRARVRPRDRAAGARSCREHGRSASRRRAAWSTRYRRRPRRFLRAVIDKNPDRFVRGYACLWLGQYLREQSEGGPERPGGQGERRANGRPCSSSRAATRRASSGSAGRDPDALMTQAEAAFERVVKEFGDMPGSRDGTLGQEARSELNEIRNLVPGKPAPEVTGADVDGRPIKLSDYRGRVVLISFWGQQWGSLRRQIPYERDARGADERPAVRRARRQRRRQGAAPGPDQEGRHHLALVVGPRPRCRHPRPDRPAVQHPHPADALPHRPSRRHPPQVRRHLRCRASWTPRSTSSSRPRSETPPRLERRGPLIYSRGASRLARESGREPIRPAGVLPSGGRFRLKPVLQPGHAPVPAGVPPSGGTEGPSPRPPALTPHDQGGNLS